MENIYIFNTEFDNNASIIYILYNFRTYTLRISQNININDLNNNNIIVPNDFNINFYFVKNNLNEDLLFEINPSVLHLLIL